MQATYCGLPLTLVRHQLHDLRWWDLGLRESVTVMVYPKTAHPPMRLVICWKQHLVPTTGIGNLIHVCSTMMLAVWNSHMTLTGWFLNSTYSLKNKGAWTVLHSDAVEKNHFWFHKEPFCHRFFKEPSLSYLFYNLKNLLLPQRSFCETERFFI